MLTYTFQKDSGISLYEQLYRNIKEDILTGKLQAGEKLPSKRTLAGHLEVSVITVKNAYEQLMAEGYIYGIEKKGYYVSSMERPISAAPMTYDIQKTHEQTWFLDFVTNSISVRIIQKIKKSVLSIL